LRRDSNYRIGFSPKHLTFFEMLELFDFHANNFQLFEDAIYFITSKIDSSKISINVATPSPLKELVESTNLKIHYLPRENLIWHLKGGKYSGDRIEINYETPKIFCELWNLSYICNNTITSLVDSGMCLERLNMAINEYKNVFETEELLNIKKKLSKQISFEEPLSNYISDQLRALQKLFLQDILPGPRGANGETRKLLKNVLVRIKNNDTDLNIIKEFLPYDNILNQEILIFEKNYNKAIRYLKNNLKQKTYDIQKVRELRMNQTIQEPRVFNWAQKNNIFFSLSKKNINIIGKETGINLFDLEKILGEEQ